MEGFLSKFGLYEIFRIILPGSYFLFLCYIPSKAALDSFFIQFHWAAIAIVLACCSFALGSLIYALDIARLFKSWIDFLPTNLMCKEFKHLFPPTNVMENEHIYYQWYEKSNNKSKAKTELQSSLYHFALNFSFCALFGIGVGIYMLWKLNTNFVLIINVALFIFTSLSALLIVKVRLRYQWRRNYWEFRYEFIQKSPEVW
jgi:hypothetical protein